MRMTFALARAGFRRYSTYRQSTVASTVTNTVFGFLRVYVLFAAAAANGGVAAGYTAEQLSTYTWVTQGLLGVVALWGWNELADKVRTGEVAGDLLRPVNPVWIYFATDLGRAGFASCTRLVVPIAVGALAFGIYWPRQPASYPLFAVSVLLAVSVCFALRYLMNLSAFWLLDNRGIATVWALVSGIGAGLYFPMDFLPDGLAFALKYLTPFPSIMQFPADVLIERDGFAGQSIRISVQALWALVSFVLVFAVQRKAVRKLVIQGG